jgi:acetyl/propionyl-CoA carboxylase alpha subunit
VEALRSMGSKSAAKRIMTAAGVPVTPAYYGENQDPQHLAQQAEKVRVSRQHHHRHCRQHHFYP